MSSSFPGPLPPRWLHCPRKSTELIAGKFLAMKTPLDTRYDPQIEPQFRFSPEMLMQSMKSYKAKIGLWIDLTNTSRFYDKKIVESLGCKYVKLQCRGHGESPSTDTTDTFVRICSKFIQKNPLEIIAVHCTHGFNRSGFLISAYLIQTEDWSPEAASGAFAKARPPGIYKADYIQELFNRYGDPTDAPAVPELPDWCYEEENTGVDEDGNAIAKEEQSTSSNGGTPRKRDFSKKNPQFMAGVPGVTSVTQQPTLTEVQRKVQKMCEFKKNGFPGAQPVSMDRENMNNLALMPYKVSWKADGTRYMMLIDGHNKIYFIDRDNCVFQVSDLTFLHRKMPNKHISNTLLDGEMVIDEVNDQRFPRYLIYDIIRFENEEVGKTVFSTRLLCIDKEIIQTRAKYIAEGKIDKNKEPFSIRKKEFWPLSETKVLLGPKFTKASLGHEPDGLVFQPSDEPYKAGRDDLVLKWKPHTHNSVDFKLQIVKDCSPGMLPETKYLLFVGGHPHPVGQLATKLKKDMREQLQNKIVECTWDEQKRGWVFMRERTDKSYPNAYATAQGVIKSIAEPVTTSMLLEFIEHRQYRRPDQHSNGQMRPPPPKMQRTH